MSRLPICCALLLTVSFHANAAGPSPAAAPAAPPAAPRADVQPRTGSSRAELIRVLTETRVAVRFEGTAARDAIAYLQAVLGIPIIGRYEDDRIGTGIDPDMKIDLTMADVPALEVLESVLETCSEEVGPCTWQLRRGYVEVGTKKRLAVPMPQEVRIYPIRDLLFEPPRFDNAPGIDLDAALSQGSTAGGSGTGAAGGGANGGGNSGGSIIKWSDDEPEVDDERARAALLVELIREIVEPEGWWESGGDWARIRARGDVLVVRAPDFIHRQIDDASAR